MSKCENCIHYDRCDHYHIATDTGKYAYQNINLEKRDDVEDICDDFKDKSLFVKLKCNLGQLVYAIVSPEKINEVRVRQIEIVPCEDKTYVHYRVGRCAWFYEEEIGKTVFLTKDEAEKKLKEKG